MGQTGSRAKSLAKTKKPKEDKKADENDSSSSARRVVKLIESVEEEEGLGAKVQRTIGCEEFDYLDPFLRLDEFDVLKPAGFPDHPHRGYETVTYILKGCLDYEDFQGNKGSLQDGDLQVIMSKSEGGARVRVIAGEALGKKSSVTTRTPTLFLDVELEEKASISQVIPQGWNAFIYILSGKANIGPEKNVKEGTKHQILVLGDGISVEASNKEAELCHFLLIAGKPLNEPVEREGNFVMNTVEEVEEGIKDHRFGRNGFENAPDWNSQSALAYLDSQF
eukprot:XP_011668450.1 PREDICTED: pirin-like [Strongylocentrotus purpuratus]